MSTKASSEERIDEKLYDLKSRRKGFKGAVTRCVGEIRGLIDAKRQGKLAPSQEQIAAKFESIQKTVVNLESNHEAICALLSDQVDLDEANSYIEGIHKDIDDVKRYANETSSDDMKHEKKIKSEEPINPLGAESETIPSKFDAEVNPEDSISQVTTNVSKSSSIASSKAKAAARAAALAVERKKLQQIQKMEQEELIIKQKKAALELETQIEVAKVEQEVYEELETRSSHRSSRHRQLGSAVSKARKDVPPLENQPRLPVLNPEATAWKPVSDNVLMDIMYKGQTQQQKILDAMSLPKVELIKYDGDPLKYWLFCRQFENSVACLNETDNGQKLLLLMQYCVGKAKRVIECCLAMEPSYGYVRARELLKERFGNEFVIVETWVNKLTNGGMIKASDKSSLVDLADELRNCVENLNAMGYLSEVNTQSVLLKIVQRLPLFLRNRWLREVQHIRKKALRNPEVADLMEFVEEAAAECNDPVYGRLNEVNESTHRRQNRERGSSFTTAVSANPDSRTRDIIPPCLLCKQPHGLFACNTFKGMTVSERRKLAGDKRLCFNCLTPGHNAKDCGLKRTCTVNGCGKRHTKFLHCVVSEQGVPNIVQEDAETVTQVEVMCSATVAGVITKVALPIIPVQVRASAKTEPIVVQALLDNGSTNTFAAHELVSKLKLQGKKKILTLTTLENADSRFESMLVDFEIAPIGSDRFMSLESVYAKSVIPVKDSNIAKPWEIENWAHFQGLEFPPVNPSQVLLLIGQDNPDLLLPREVRSGAPGMPYATRTLLGWTMNGPLGLLSSKGEQQVSSHFVTTCNTLDSQLERFWRIDDWETPLTEKACMSLEDRQALSVWEDSVQLNNAGHYVLDIPFRSNPPKLPPNRDLVEKRLHGLKKRLLRDEDLYRQYCDNMETLIRKGYAELVENPTERKEGKTWYLPHHPVFHPKKPGKMRIVFDCAAQENGVSLNSRVLQGPDLTNSLVGVLLRFRQRPVAIMADIEAMFNQVHVTPEQRDSLRFLWWPNGDLKEEPLTYRMTTHLFGGTWSPSCCNFALRRVAENNKDSFDSKILEMISRDFYVDDCLSSLESEDQAIAVITDLPKLLEKGGFRLTKWMSNRRNVLAAVSEEERAKEVKGLDLNFDALPVERALGVSWDVENDYFYFNNNLPDKPLTRRGLLSVVSSIYDPLGFISPFTVTARRILQDLTRKNIGWDECLPENELKRWNQWRTDLQGITEMKISRCLNPDGKRIKRHELHNFSDASEIAYGVVSFLRSEDENGSIECSLVMSKSRVAPVKNMTIPRLELSSAALAVKLNATLIEELDIEISESFFWTDSTIVLAYINNVKKRFQTFVANRLAIIHQGSEVHQWHHVQTELNPADDISRGLTAQQIVNSVRWIKGPSFLSEQKDSWPKDIPMKDAAEGELEEKQEKKASVFTAGVDARPVDKLIERYSSWHKLKRGVAWILKFTDWLKEKAQGRSDIVSVIKRSLEVSDLQRAEKSLIRYVQKCNFEEEFLSQAKRRSGDKSKSSKNGSLRSLDPVLDPEGLLRIGGRLRNANIPEVQKSPLILPKYHHISTLIIRECHETSGHVGREYVLSLVRQNYWLISGRNAVKQVLKDCVLCKRYFAKPEVQRMADLPACRVQADQPPFTYVGVDFFGPILVKRGRSEVKRYGCLFTCLTVRAVHLEVSHSLETDSFINVLHRFISRRGRPMEIYCDNGTNFVGAEKQLKRSIQEWNHDQVHKFLSRREICWKFNPPKAPHMGGVWERMVGFTKKILTSLLKGQTTDDEGLTTLLCIVESIINGRPLTGNSDDPSDVGALTPNSLLLPGAPCMLPEGLFSKDDLYCRRRWRQTQYLADVFWKRWTREYLPTLQSRSKWIDAKRNFTVGDVVLMVEETPRNSWPLGRIIEVYPGDDGKVRSVKVKSQFSVLERPITKLCLLEATEMS